MKPISRYLSQKLTVLYTLLVIMVLYIHCYFSEAQQYPSLLFLQRFWGFGVCGIANCFFFFLSGYMFARNINHIGDLWSKQKKRARTLVLPYILWNLIIVLWSVVFELIPGLDSLNNGESLARHIISQSVYSAVHTLFFRPASFHLWFLRDLIYMIAITPIIWWLSRKNVVLSLIAAILVMPFWGWVVYYWTGNILATKDIDLEGYRRNYWVLAICASCVLAHAIYLGLGYNYLSYVAIIINFMGIYTIWVVYDILAGNKQFVDKGIWKFICGFSFFVYCFHIPILRILKKLSLICFGTSQFSLLLQYIFDPWIMLIVAVIIARLLRYIIPMPYKILTGDR